MKGKRKVRGTAPLPVSIKDLWVELDGTVVLEDITLDIEERTFLGIIGPNGSGKTTLLKAMLGLLPISRGTVRLFGQTPERGRRHVGYVPQYTRYDKDFPISVWDVVLMGRLSRRGAFSWFSKEDRTSAKDALDSVGMYEFRDRHIDGLSGGQRQRVFIARALASGPRLLILDEPTASVDTTFQRGIYDLLKRLKEEEGKTIVLVTHDIGVISAYVTKVACLNRTLVSHDEHGLTKEMLEKTYHCPVELIAHGVPHRVLEEHQ